MSVIGAGLMVSSAASQEMAAALQEKAKMYFHAVERLEINAASTRTNLLQGNLAERLDLKDAAQTVGFLQEVAPFFGLNNARDNFAVSKSFADVLGMIRKPKPC